MPRNPILRGLALSTAVLLTLSACGQDEAETASPESTTSAEATAGGNPTGAQEILDDYDIEGDDSVEVIDYMDRLGGDERPQELMASVRVDELVLTSGDREETLPIPEDRFYISMAPYVDSTHDCFYHSLTTCQGELVEEDLKVTVVDETNDEVLIDETVTTFENGFYGFWAPRDIQGTITVEHGDRSGTLEFATDAEAATCLTTLQLT